MDDINNSTAIFGNELIWDELIPVGDVHSTDNPASPQTMEEPYIKCRIIPMLFNFIMSLMFVKQQPKANNRLRYACDGSRFLPDSRYHPMTLGVCFCLV